jgi:hypothetical protein
MMSSVASSRVLVGCLTLLALVSVPQRARAQDRLGGHFGAVFPLLNHVGGDTTTIADDFTIGFPMGITVKTSDKWAFDLELVPVIQNDPLSVSLTVHPGVIHALEDGWAVGLRMAFDVNAASWGFTPLVNKALVHGPGCTWFVEGVVPIRFQSDPAGGNRTSIGLAVHTGVGF